MRSLRLATILLIAVIAGLVAALPAFASQLDDGLAAYDQRNYDTALKLLRPLADQGIAAAQHRLGFMYSFGQGVSKDSAEAVKWYRKAADQGLAKSQHNLGYLYAKGDGVTRDSAESAKWYTKAAEQGNIESQSALSLICARGDGIPKNLVEAYKWSDLAASNSTDKDARDRHIKNRDLLAATMTPAQITEAQKLAREWKSKQEPPKQP